MGVNVLIECGWWHEEDVSGVKKMLIKSAPGPCVWYGLCKVIELINTMGECVHLDAQVLQVQEARGDNRAE